MTETTIRHEAAVDTKIAAAWEHYDQKAHAARLALDKIAQFVIEKDYVATGRGRKKWGYVERLSAETVIDRFLAGEFTENWKKPYNALAIKSAGDIVGHYRIAKAEADEALTAAEAAEAEYGGWQRFFLVTNTNGHIHATRACQTCYPTTQFAWLPGLSGLTEADAVAEHGPRLCTVCFPTAPVEWTLGITKDYCPGQPTGEAYGIFTGSRTTTYRTCDTCGQDVAETASGALRKHKPKKK